MVKWVYASNKEWSEFCSRLYNTIQYNDIVYNTTITKASHKSEFILTKDTP